MPLVFSLQRFHITENDESLKENIWALQRLQEKKGNKTNKIQDSGEMG